MVWPANKCGKQLSAVAADRLPQVRPPLRPHPFQSNHEVVTFY